MLTQVSGEKCPENSTMITRLKDCIDFSSWNSRLAHAVVFTFTAVVLIGSGFLIYGIVHVTGQFVFMVPLMKSMHALQDFQFPLQKAEHGMFSFTTMGVIRFLTVNCVLQFWRCCDIQLHFVFAPQQMLPMPRG